MIAIVAAHDRNRVIGLHGALPWHLPTDLQRFRDLTMGSIVVMGRKTFESLPSGFRPLPGRRNFVLSRRSDYAPVGAEAFADLDSALAASGGACFVIGGEKVFEAALPRAERLYLTVVDAECVGDAFFPLIDAQSWQRVDESDAIIENGYEYVFHVYDRAA